jgi:hypothetical protein
MNFNRLRAAGFGLVGLAASLTLLACSRPPKGTFETKEAAVQAIADIAGKHDTARVVEMFGPDGPEMFSSGDEQDDAEDAQRVKAMIAEKVAFEDVDETTKIPLLGKDAWPLPFPLKLVEGRWRFDADAGREELLNRRIGRNELLALASLHAYVDAQREYFSQSRDGKPPAYARRVWSSDGMHDGLYWAAAESEPESPLGPLLADAAADRKPNAVPQPYNGYYFRILEAQGKSAPGGERSYLDEKGLMTRGFAAIAWPAKYGNSGVMSFQVDEQGMIFQKDLGAETDAAVAAITAYDPDDSWAPDPD